MTDFFKNAMRVVRDGWVNGWRFCRIVTLLSIGLHASLTLWSVGRPFFSWFQVGFSVGVHLLLIAAMPRRRREVAP